MSENKKMTEDTLKISVEILEKRYIPTCAELAKSIWKDAGDYFGSNGENLRLALYLEHADEDDKKKKEGDIAASIDEFTPKIYRREGVYSCEGKLKANESNILQKLKEVENDELTIQGVGFWEERKVTSGQKKVVYNDNYGDFRAIWVVYLLGNSESTPKLQVCDIMLNTLAKYVSNQFDDINMIIAESIGMRIKDCKDTSDREKAIEYEKFSQMYYERIFDIHSYLPHIEECMYLGLQDYEGREPKGAIAFLNEEYNGEGVFVDLSENSSFFNYKFTRKMLECIQNEQCLLVSGKGKEVLGITAINNIKNIPHILLEYHGLADWSILCKDEEILRYRRGKYYISNGEYKEEVRKKLNKYPNLTKEIIEVIERIVDKMHKCEHGALLIVTRNGKDGEYFKRARSGIKLREAMKVDEIVDYVTGIATVDGAVILNYTQEDGSDCVCEAFGAILDSEPKIKGEPARGSRYNSARKYIYGKDALAVIISEDKTNGIEIYHGIEDTFELIEMDA